VSLLDSEALALMALGYRAASYLELYCPDHGAIRCAVAAEGPQPRHPCPLCNRSCRCGYMCRGFTKRALPFYERITAAAAIWPTPDSGRRRVVRPTVPSDERKYQRAHVCR
jgi:hypothetical protein